MVRGDLLAAGSKLAKRIAASGQERQHTVLISHGKIGKVSPPSFGVNDGVGAALAACLDDECIAQVQFFPVVAAVDDLTACNDLRAGPPDA